MAGLTFLIALVLGGSALLYQRAAEGGYAGTSWAGDICSTSQLFCQHPEYLGDAGLALLIIAIGIRLGRLVS